MGAVVATSPPDLHSAVMRSTPHGADAVLITAGSPDDGPVTLAAEVARDRASVVAVGAVGLNLPRKLYYEKELDFRVSRSYGPGRYDPQYEERGHDYPIGYVRWTEGRNLQSFLDLLAAGKLQIEPLISHRFSIEQAPRAYDLIAGKTGEPSLGVLITYPEQMADSAGSVTIAARKGSGARLRLGLLGAGSFATATLLPAIIATGAELVSVCARNGASAFHAASKFGFCTATTSASELLADPGVNLVAICTRHNLHAEQVQSALRAGKHVFCEKPLCLTANELRDIASAYQSAQGCRLFVGYNRRFAPMSLRLKEFTGRIREPLVLHYRVNAGYVPSNHWAQDPQEGGGRIVGEMCHFVDQLMFLCGSQPVRVQARTLSDNGRYSSDNVLATIEFANGSLGTITYVANGSRAFSKERLEVFGGGASAVLDDFRVLELLGDKRSTLRSRWKQDKGHKGEWEAISKSLEAGLPFSIPFEELVASTLTVFAIRESVKTGAPIAIDAAAFLAAAKAQEDFPAGSTRSEDER
jgi:predicted dehydrogenase